MYAKNKSRTSTYTVGEQVSDKIIIYKLNGEPVLQEISTRMFPDEQNHSYCKVLRDLLKVLEVELPKVRQCYGCGYGLLLKGPFQITA